MSLYPESQETIMQPHTYPPASSPPTPAAAPAVVYAAAPAAAPAAAYAVAPTAAPAGPTILQLAGPSRVGPEPSMITCAVCQRSVLTNVKYKAVGKTHILAVCLCLLGFCPCMWIPYVTNTCRNADHYCPGCNTFIGTYEA